LIFIYGITEDKTLRQLTMPFLFIRYAVFTTKSITSIPIIFG